MTDTETKVKLREELVAWREVEGKIVALDMHASEYFAVNETGTAIWPLLAQGATQEQLTSRLVEMYGIDEPSAERDVQSFLSSLADRELLAQG